MGTRAPFRFSRALAVTTASFSLAAGRMYWPAARCLPR